MRTELQTAGAFTAGLCLAALASVAEPIHDIELVNGDTVEAIVIPATEFPVVVQTEEWCLEVPIDRIRRIDGSSDVTSALRTERPPLLRQTTFEELREDGSVLLRSSFARMNRGTEARHELEWGLAPHEIPLLDHWKVFDEFGNELPLRVEDGAAEVKRALVRLVRPILPGETVRFTSEILFREQLARDGDRWVYRNVGNYPDDRLVSRMLQLPAGAEVVSASPDDAEILEVDGVTFVHWRRYFAAGEETPLEVVFRSTG